MRWKQQSRRVLLAGQGTAQVVDAVPVQPHEATRPAVAAATAAAEPTAGGGSTAIADAGDATAERRHSVGSQLDAAAQQQGLCDHDEVQPGQQPPQHQPQQMQDHAIDGPSAATGAEQAAATPAPAAAAAAPAAAPAPAPAKRRDTRSAMAKKLGWGSPKRRRKKAVSGPPKARSPAPAVAKSGGRAQELELTEEQREKKAAEKRAREDAALARTLQAQFGGGYVRDRPAAITLVALRADELKCAVHAAGCTVDASHGSQRCSIQWLRPLGPSWHTQMACAKQGARLAVHKATAPTSAATGARPGTRLARSASVLMRRRHLLPGFVASAWGRTGAETASQGRRSRARSKPRPSWRI